MPSPRTYFLPLCLLLLAAACRPVPVRPPDLAGTPDPAQVLEGLRREASARRSMRALGRVTYFGEKGRVRLSAVIVVQRPRSFRVETVSPFEQPIDTMVSTGERISLLSGGQLYEGPATPENIARLIPAPLRPEEMVETMLGGFPMSERFTPAGLVADGEAWRLTLSAGTGERLELRVLQDRMLVDQGTLYRPDGTVRLGVEFGDFEPTAAGPFPRKIILRVPDRDMEVTIKLKEVDVNVEIPASIFTLPPPPGVPVIPLASPPVPLPVRTSTAGAHPR